MPSDIYEALEQDSFTQAMYEHLLNSIKQDVQKEQKTATEHNAHMVELERMNNAMVGRELKMIELKAKIAKLEKDATSKHPLNLVLSELNSMSETEQAKIERGVLANTKLALFDVGGVLFRFMGGGRSPQ